MKVSQTDPRSIRTRILLRQALIQLAARRRLDTLSIQDVTRQAGLNRTTFYRHYTGLPELLEDCARTLFAQMRAEVYAHQHPGPAPHPSVLTPFIESVFRHLERHEAFYRAMLGRQGDPLFRGLFQDWLFELIVEPIDLPKPRQAQSDQLEMATRFFSAGFAGIAAWWLDQGKPISIRQAAQHVARDLLPDYLRLVMAYHTLNDPNRAG